jgi:hypothetical protein
LSQTIGVRCVTSAAKEYSIQLPSAEDVELTASRIWLASPPQIAVSKNLQQQQQQQHNNMGYSSV